MVPGAERVPSHDLGNHSPSGGSVGAGVMNPQGMGMPPHGSGTGNDLGVAKPKRGRKPRKRKTEEMLVSLQIAVFFPKASHFSDPLIFLYAIFFSERGSYVFPLRRNGRSFSGKYNVCK